MPTRDVPRAEWPEFLDSFSRQHRAWLATIDDPRSAGGRSSEPRPLERVTAERDGARVTAIDIAFSTGGDRGPVRVDNPAAVRVRQTDDGADRGLEIVDDRGRCTQISFRAAARPEMLDGLAPGEL